MKNIIIGLVSLLVLLIVVVAYQLSRFFSVSSGTLIEKYQAPRTALLVMDMQMEFNAAAQKIVSEVNRAVDHFSAKGDLVVYIKTQYSKADHILNFIRKNSAVEDTPGVGFIDGLKMASQNVFAKDRMDAFSNPALGEFLVKNQVGHLYVAGLDGCYCVDKTVRAALNRGYRVTLLADAAVSKKDAEFQAVKENLKAAGVEVSSVAELVK